ncbi:50S ribosomal protein L3 N(5)-glutamine methyltransferase [Gilvimarinus sp. F26214L]|uniref:50S ribosomal protein L3 N(5)-glutamine methyltransferase n=1 Tax=Gilvimarinus sp. DZF01 TaxID=3461371 RepID=UPI00404580A5
MATTYTWPSAPCTVQEALGCAEYNFQQANLYFGHGTDNAWDEAVALALHGLGLSWMDESWDREAILQRPLDQAELSRLVELFERRIDERIPAAYITGSAVFAGLEFRVTEDVLVPRSPVAELIENHYAPWVQEAPDKVLDLCTGSGCIGIATALAFPEALVDLSDISRAAHTVAEHNLLAYGLQDRVRAVEGDLFSAVEGEQYDLIVCNPPYVDAEDLAAMPAEYQAEPEIALGSGPDGLDFCRRLLREAPDFLSERGCLIVEVGNSWEALEAAYPRVPFTWLEFARGGHGVFVLTAEELQRHFR